MYCNCVIVPSKYCKVKATAVKRNEQKYVSKMPSFEELLMTITELGALTF